MQLPGLITLDPQDEAALERAAHVISHAFLEEPWFTEWLTALDVLGTSTSRKREILYAELRGEIDELSTVGGVLVTPDFSAVAGGYHQSDLGGGRSHDLFERAKKRYAHLYTPDEARLLEEKSRQMEAVSVFDWAFDEMNGEDHIYFSFWGVDKNARKKGTFRQLTNPIFEFADNRQIPVFLDCCSAPLQSLYEHVGFELIEAHKGIDLPIYERRMVRYPQGWSR